MSSILAVAYREYRIRLTNPILPMWDVLVPVIYLLVFGASVQHWLGGALAAVDYPTFFLGGVLGMVTFSVAFNSSYSFFEDLQSGIFHELLTYPFPRRDLLLGKLLFNAALSVVGALLCVAAGVAVLGIPIRAAALPATVGVVLLGTAAWYFLLSWIALRARGFNAYHTTTSTLYLILMFVSNLFYPADRLPAWIGWLAWANPLTWQVELTRWALYGGGDPDRLPFELVAQILFCGVTFVVADRALNRPVE